MPFNLETPPTFSLPAVVRSHGWCQMSPFSETAEHGLSYVIRLSSGRVVHFEVHTDNGGLRVDTSAPLDGSEQAELSQAVRWMLAMEQDLTEFYTLARSEPKLAKMVERQAGRVLRSPTVFEDVIRTILTTNTLWKHTLRMCRELTTRYGEPVPDDPTRHAFPTPERLAHVGEAELIEYCRMGYRAPYVAELTQRVAAGELDLEAFKVSPLPSLELRKQLIGIKGVGGYAAANLLILLGRFDYLPVDSWALKTVSNEFFGGEKITPKQVLSSFEKWGKWQGLVYYFWDWTPSS